MKHEIRNRATLFSRTSFVVAVVCLVASSVAVAEPQRVTPRVGAETSAKAEASEDADELPALSSAVAAPKSTSKKASTLDDATPLVGRKRVTLRRLSHARSSIELPSADGQNAELKEENDAEKNVSEPGDADALVVLGREIADYRTTAGAGRYVFEDERGVLRFFDADDVESIEDAPDSTLGELREKLVKELRDEFGAKFSVKTTDRYLFVYDSSDGYVEWCARLFDNLESGFEKYAAKNGFELKERIEPMIVVVFATKSEFIRYASRETPSADRVAAYYNMETNRVVLYDLSEAEGTAAADASPRRRREYQETKAFLSRPNAEFNVATIVHEATHQIAFNRGLFQRTGPIALWAVEGLSLLFETPNGKVSQGGWGYRSAFPINKRQLGFFASYVNTTAQKDPLRDLVRQDNFMNNAQGSYAASWALFYYLNKKYPKELARYILDISARPPCAVYSPEERVADFEKYFGNDWERLMENVVRLLRKYD